MDCGFATEAEDEDSLIAQMMEHIQAGHEDDWFEAEEVYQAVCERLRKNAA